MQNKSIPSIALLRPIAALMVVWYHLANLWSQSHQLPPWTISIFMHKFIETPLGIMQNFGWFGVSLFFLISGFIITFVAEREDRRKFIIRRLFRIYPPYIFSLLVILFIYKGFRHFSLTQFLWSASLLNFFRTPFVIPNPVAWTLIIEMLFYVTIFLFLPLLNKRPQYFVILVLALTELAVLLLHSLGAGFFLFANSFSYLPFLILGQIVYFYWSKKWSLTRTLLNGALIYGVLLTMLLKVHPEFYPANNSYLISVTYALIIFVFALQLNDKIKLVQPLRFLSESSYSLYLLHFMVGFYCLNQLTKFMHFSSAFAVTLMIIFGLTYISWKFVEVPTQKLARKMTTNTKSRVDQYPLKNEADQSSA